MPPKTKTVTPRTNPPRSTTPRKAHEGISPKGAAKAKASPEESAKATPPVRQESLDAVEEPPSKDREPLHVPKLLRSRSSPPKAPSGPNTFGASKEDNETVAGCVEHDTRIRSGMPLNPTAEESSEAKALPVHPAAQAAQEKGKKRRGVKRYAGIGAQASCVDQVIFGRDMDFTSVGDDKDAKEYDGRAGLPSRGAFKAGGVKKADGPKQGNLVHGFSGVTVEVQAEKVKKRAPGTLTSPNCSPGITEVFRLSKPEKDVKVAWGSGAGAGKSHKARTQEALTHRGTQVSAVVFGGEGHVTEKSSVADSRKKRVDPQEAFADLAGRKCAELHEVRGKRLVTRDSDSGSAGCPSSSLGDQLAGWHPEARDRLVRTAAGFEEPQSAIGCDTGKVLYGQATPRKEALWAERKANALRQVPGRKHLGTLQMPFMDQQADIFQEAARTTPSSGSMVCSLFEGSAGKPSTLSEWDVPKPSRSVTPPPKPSDKVYGLPSQTASMEGGVRRTRGASGPNPVYGPSKVGGLLCWDA